jgi:hypothetical protein
MAKFTLKLNSDPNMTERLAIFRVALALFSAVFPWTICLNAITSTTPSTILENEFFL